ncbi:condensation domain-containing protein [Sporolactobacillus sp. Y61]|uniref:Condensation domain-containing protein n=1 Tax=Sporolactobacillus sp. Y61 TaxID=3160863 RepID=A0AAU8IDG6_9BACL
MTTLSRQIYPAESADIKHYISGQKKRNDHYLHAVIHLDAHIDEDLLKKAVDVTMDAVPLLGCRFVETPEKAYWIPAGWTASDMVQLVRTDHVKAKVYQHLIIKPDEKKGPQMRLTIVRGEATDALAIVLNHMICDGGGIRDYLYLLCDCYNRLAEKPDEEIKNLPDPARRSIRQVFDQMSASQMNQIKHAELQNYPQTKKDYLPLQGDERTPFIMTHKVSADRFDKIKSFAKSEGATINDALFAAYICALSRNLRTDMIAVDCPVNLRTFLPKDYQPGLCNLTSNIVCAVPSHAGESFEKALSEVKQVMSIQKGNLEPLRVYWELENVYQTLPLHQAKQQFPEIYSIPKNGLTNIGVLDDSKLVFDGVRSVDASISGSIKYAPYFQVAITTFRKEMTFSTNFHGTSEDYMWLDHFVHRIISYLPE